MSKFYILIAIIVLAVLASAAFFVKKRPQKPFSKLATFAFIFILASFIFSENQLIGYSLMGIGIAFAVIDIIKKLKKAQ
jgi:hypothetical protein